MGTDVELDESTFAVADFNPGDANTMDVDDAATGDDELVAETLLRPRQRMVRWYF